MSEDEIRLAKKWYEKDKLKPSEIAERLGRDKSALTRLLVLQSPRKQQGRKPLLTEAQIDFLARRLDEMVRKANCEYTVTVGMRKRNTRVGASEKSIFKALHSRNIYFRRLREKPVLLLRVSSMTPLPFLH